MEQTFLAKDDFLIYSFTQSYLIYLFIIGHISLLMLPLPLHPFPIICSPSAISTLSSCWLRIYLQYEFPYNCISKSMETLRDRQVQQLLKLEELFHSHYLTEELLNDMIGLYVRFAESTPLGQHPIRLYFMEKIRFVLSRPEVIRGLDKEEARQSTGGRKLEEPRHVAHNGIKKTAVSGEVEQRQRGAKIQLQMKVMREVEEGMNAFKEGMGRESERRQQKETEINQLVNEQDQILAERRANRKKKLRKKSANFTEKEILIEPQAPPIPVAELKLVQIVLQQTYERFTRLTQNKLMRQESNKKPNQGRVKFQIEEHTYEDEEYFDQLNKEVKPEEIQPAPKKKSSLLIQNESQTSVAPAPPRETTTVQYKTFDHNNKGRVTTRNNQYQEIEEQEF